MQTSEHIAEFIEFLEECDNKNINWQALAEAMNQYSLGLRKAKHQISTQRFSGKGVDFDLLEDKVGGFFLKAADLVKLNKIDYRNSFRDFLNASNNDFDNLIQAIDHLLNALENMKLEVETRKHIDGADILAKGIIYLYQAFRALE